jgi:hypothetical protein
VICPSTRLAEALELLDDLYGVRPPAPDDPDEVLTFLAEAMAAVAPPARNMVIAPTSEKTNEGEAAMVRRCTRCQGSIIEQRFTDVYARGILWSCIACGEETELLPPPAALRRILARSDYTPPRGRQKKTAP